MDLKCVTENYGGFYGTPKSHGLIACALILHFSCHGFYAKTEGKQFPNLASNVGCSSMHSFHKRQSIVTNITTGKRRKTKKARTNQSINQSLRTTVVFSCQTRSNKCDNASAIANRNMYCHILLKYNRCVSLAYVHCSNLKFVLQVTPSLFIC